MSQARVTNVAALPEFRAMLATFAVEVRQALDEVEMEARKALDWITHDQPAYWQGEIRRSSDAVARAKDDLSQSRTYKRIDEYVPSCAEEKKVLECAKQRQESCRAETGNGQAVGQGGAAGGRQVQRAHPAINGECSTAIFPAPWRCSIE